MSDDLVDGVMNVLTSIITLLHNCKQLLVSGFQCHVSLLLKKDLLVLHAWRYCFWLLDSSKRYSVKIIYITERNITTRPKNLQSQKFISQMLRVSKLKKVKVVSIHISETFARNQVDCFCFRLFEVHIERFAVDFAPGTLFDQIAGFFHYQYLWNKPISVLDFFA